MAWFANLKIGKKYEFFSRKYTIPYTWCKIFDGFNSSGISKTIAKRARERLCSNGLTLDLIEKQMSDYNGWDISEWRQCRNFVLKEDYYGLKRRLDKSDSEEEENVLDLLESLQDDHGLFELVALYRLLLAVETVDPSEVITLDISEFALDDNELGEVIKESQKDFIDTVNVYRFLERYVVDNRDKTLLVKSKLSSLTKDELIDEILMVLLPKMGFYNVSRIHHHGLFESGLDVRPFYEIDKFGRRIYYGAQVKAVDINAHSSKKEGGNVESASLQLQLALDSKFLDEEDNEEKEIDRVLLVTSKNINDLTRNVFRKKFPNRQLSLIDGTMLADLIVKNELIDRVLHIRKEPKRPWRGSINRSDKSTLF